MGNKVKLNADIRKQKLEDEKKKKGKGKQEQ